MNKEILWGIFHNNRSVKDLKVWFVICWYIFYGWRGVIIKNTSI